MESDNWGVDPEVCSVRVPEELVYGLISVMTNALELWQRDVAGEVEGPVLAGAVLIAGKILAADILGEEIETETIQ